MSSPTEGGSEIVIQCGSCGDTFYVLNGEVVVQCPVCGEDIQLEEAEEEEEE